MYAWKCTGICKNTWVKKWILELYSYQLDEILKNIDFLRKKYRISKKCKIILSGIGQEILMNYLNKKVNDTIFLFDLLGSKHYEEASYHAPALSLALLLFEKK